MVINKSLHFCNQARVYLLSAGFSLAFGSMFTKTYRVHRIFTRSRSGVVKNKVSSLLLCVHVCTIISLCCLFLLLITSLHSIYDSYDAWCLYACTRKGHNYYQCLTDGMYCHMALTHHSISYAHLFHTYNYEHQEEYVIFHLLTEDMDVGRSTEIM